MEILIASLTGCKKDFLISSKLAPYLITWIVIRKQTLTCSGLYGSEYGLNKFT